MCIFCLFGFEFDGYPNRIQRVQLRNPNLHKWALDELGLREVMDYMDYDHTLTEDEINKINMEANK